MIGVALIAGVFAVTGRRIERFEGALLLVIFGVYAFLVFT
jgi:Ca2+/Na+ antiporter